MAAVAWARILVPTDLSDAAKQAVDYAHGLAEKFEAELHVLHVVKNVSDLAKEHGVVGVIEPGAEAQPQRLLAEMLGETGTVRRVEAVRVGADPAEAIVRYIRDEKIDVVIVTTHGRTGLKHLLVGSVAEKLLRTVPCPMLVLRV